MTDEHRVDRFARSVAPADPAAALSEAKLKDAVRAKATDRNHGPRPVRPLRAAAAQIGQIRTGPLRFFFAGGRFVAVVRDDSRALVTVQQRVEPTPQELPHILLGIALATDICQRGINPQKIRPVQSQARFDCAGEKLGTATLVVLQTMNPVARVPLLSRRQPESHEHAITHLCHVANVVFRLDDQAAKRPGRLDTETRLAECHNTAA